MISFVSLARNPVRQCSRKLRVHQQSHSGCPQQAAIWLREVRVRALALIGSALRYK